VNALLLEFCDGGAESCLFPLLSGEIFDCFEVYERVRRLKRGERREKGGEEGRKKGRKEKRRERGRGRRVRFSIPMTSSCTK